MQSPWSRQAGERKGQPWEVKPLAGASAVGQCQQLNKSGAVPFGHSIYHHVGLAPQSGTAQSQSWTDWAEGKVLYGLKNTWFSLKFLLYLTHLIAFTLMSMSCKCTICWWVLAWNELSVSVDATSFCCTKLCGQPAQASVLRQECFTAVRAQSMCLQGLVEGLTKLFKPCAGKNYILSRTTS